MPQMLDNIITGAVANEDGYTVRVTWANGETTLNRFDHLIGKGVFAAVSDPAIFAQVCVGDRGRSLEWPGEIDFCADALWFETHPADAPRTAKLSVGPAAHHAASG
jgi:hypothetical protein